jgi:alpha-glucosidase
VPGSVFPRPGGSASADDSALEFSFTLNPFSFAVSRRNSSGSALFNTSGTNLVFQSQYLRLRTSLPKSPNLYGLGEHTNTFHLPTDNFTRTLWDVDDPWVPPGKNLYGSHPVYFDHRGSDGTHGVFLLNSNGMDIKINNTETDGQYLEYNTLGGVIDLYILSGPDPEDVSIQYAEIAGLPAMIPYWSLGYHQCKYGYQDIDEVAEVIANYSAAGIPLETMWNDIDYMDLRKDFTTDPDRYPLSKFREMITYLHDHQQHSVLMTDPTIPQDDYGPYNRGVDSDVFLKRSNGSLYTNVMWPGVVAIPDWFAPNISEYWTNEILNFFDPDTGLDIDGIWIDMNEDSVFCPYPCNDPTGTL